MTVLQILNEVQQQVDGARLARWAVLVHHGMDYDLAVDVGQLLPLLVVMNRLYDGEGPVLMILVLPSPPECAEDLAGTEVVNASPQAMVLMHFWNPEAEAIDA